jgi:hypothetical protein
VFPAQVSCLDTIGKSFGLTIELDLPQTLVVRGAEQKNSRLNQLFGNLDRRAALLETSFSKGNEADKGSLS